MSTRDELIKLIAEGQGCGGHYNCARTAGLLRDEIEDATAELDAFLHELAETLRRGPHSPNEVDGAYWAADLIDPEVP